MTSHKKGFTLIELLVTIGMLSVLMSIVIVAINPSKQIANSNNAQRKVDINALANAVYQYASDNNGTLPAAISTTPTEVCRTGGTCTGLIDLSVLTTNEKYLIKIPQDPTNGSGNSSGYRISRNANGRITVSAPYAQNGETITVSQ
ncbi:MAG: type II secretion system protein [Weeksellaceae bacterium]